MQTSFWTGAVGAKAFNDDLSITANNLANVNTTGYKAKQGVFAELINYNLNREDDTPLLQAGDSQSIVRTNTDFSQSGFQTTESRTDYAIGTEGDFFMLKDPSTGEISFTRNGRFHSALMADNKFYLMTEAGKYVLDQNGNPVMSDTEDAFLLESDMATRLKGEKDDETYDYDETVEEDPPVLTAYHIPYPSRLLSKGDNEYVIRDSDTENTPTPDRDAFLKNGILEMSGVDMAREMTKVIESQRAFSYALKMVETSDEIESTVNGLRS